MFSFISIVRDEHDTNKSSLLFDDRRGRRSFDCRSEFLIAKMRFADVAR